MSVDRQSRLGRPSGIGIFTIFLIPILLLTHLGCKSRSGAARPGEKEKVRTVLHLDTFVLNLAGSDEHAYLRAGIDLGLRGVDKSEKSDASSVPLIRDTILGVLSAAKPEEVLTTQGKQALKANIVRALQEQVPELQVEEVYFTEFLIQR